MGFFEELNSPPLNHDLKSKLQKVLHVGFLSISLPAPPLQPSSSDLTGCLSWLDGNVKSLFTLPFSVWEI
jgi:anthocyanidin 3-O-glucosyltransferase